MASNSLLPFQISICLLFLLSSSTESKKHRERAPGREKVTKLRVYWHDVVSGERPTSVGVVRPVGNFSGFGGVQMTDNALTEGADVRSKEVGRAQGFYAMAGQKKMALLMAMNLVFNREKYNGSVITVIGRNEVASVTREMPVVGGTGAFRFARGFVRLKTIMFDSVSLNAIVQYNVYVVHY